MSLVLLCAGTGFSPIAWADDASTDKGFVHVIAGLRFDDNVLLLADGQAVPEGEQQSRGDWIRSLGAGWHGQVEQSRQIWRIDGEYIQNRYTRHQHFNYADWNNRLQWQWALGPHWSGVFQRFDRNQRVDAGYAPDAPQDETRTQALEGRTIWAPNTRLSVEGKMTHTRERHSVQASYDDDQSAAALGLIWSTPRGSHVGFYAGQRRVAYRQPSGADADHEAYRLRDGRLELKWPISAKTQLAGWFGQTHVRLASGSTATHGVGALMLTWRASGKTTLSLGIERDFDDPGRSRVPTIHNHRTVRASSRMSAKMTVNIEWRDETRHYDETAIGRETTRIWRALLIYRPRDALEVAPFLSRVVRTSQSITDAYVNHQMGAMVKLYF